MHEIGAADDADDLRAAHHRQALDALVLHEMHDLFERRVFGDGDRLPGHHFADLAPMGLDIFLGETARPDQEFQPARPLARGAGLGAAQEIPFRHHADQGARGIDHRQAADVILQHQPDRLQHTGIG
jgi:hypothetical protein